MKASVVYNSKNHFTVYNEEKNASFSIDSVPEGEIPQGVRPTTALLGALAVCTAYSVLGLIKKSGERLDRFEIEIDGEKTTEHPSKHFTHIVLDYKLEGTVTPEVVEKGLHLAFEKYCTVLHSLDPKISVEKKFTLNGVPY